MVDSFNKCWHESVVLDQRNLAFRMRVSPEDLLTTARAHAEEDGRSQGILQGYILSLTTEIFPGLVYHRRSIAKHHDHVKYDLYNFPESEWLSISLEAYPHLP